MQKYHLKNLCLCFLFLFLLTACQANRQPADDQSKAAASTQFNSVSEMTEAVDTMASSGLYDIDCFLESSAGYVFADENGFVVIDKEALTLSHCDFEHPQQLALRDASLYFMGDGDTTVYVLQIPSATVEAIYDSNKPIAYIQLLNNGNLLITEGSAVSESGMEVTDVTRIFNPVTKQKVPGKKDGYFGGEITVDATGDGSRLYYDRTYIDVDGYVSGECYLEDSLYYFKDDADGSTERLYRYTKYADQEEMLAEYRLEKENGVISEVPISLFAYHDRLFIEYGIDDEYKGSYRAHQFAEIDKNGTELNRYPEVEGMSYCNFFNNKIYYCTADDVIRYIAL